MFQRPREQPVPARSTVLDHNLAVRQTLKKQSAVRFRAYAGVEDCDLAGIGFSADQPSKSLFQSEHGFRELVFHERMAAAGSYALDACFE